MKQKEEEVEFFKKRITQCNKAWKDKNEQSTKYEREKYNLLLGNIVVTYCGKMLDKEVNGQILAADTQY